VNERDPSSAAQIVGCSAVCKRFGERDVLRDFDLEIERGEFAAISGPSGGGKSTLLHLLAALDRPSSGQITVNGHDLAKLRAVNQYRRDDVGIVFQLHNLLPHMTAQRNVELAMFGTHRSAHERAARAHQLLTQLGMADSAERTPTRLSGGERQRVAIARAVANEPRLLLADEPTGSLDQHAADAVLELIEGLRQRHGTTILMVTHDQAITSRADRHLVLEHGRVRPFLNRQPQ